jgi:hypothetical protein
MTIDERSRRDLHRKLESVLGEREALTLMEHLPPVGWSDVATRRDVDTLRTDMDALGKELRAELRGEVGSLRTDVNTLSAAVDALGAALRGEIASVEGRLRQEMAAQTRTLVFAMIGTMVALAALVLTASALG